MRLIYVPLRLLEYVLALLCGFGIIAASFFIVPEITRRPHRARAIRHDRACSVEGELGPQPSRNNMTTKLFPPGPNGGLFGRNLLALIRRDPLDS